MRILKRIEGIYLLHTSVSFIFLSCVGFVPIINCRKWLAEISIEIIILSRVQGIVCEDYFTRRCRGVIFQVVMYNYKYFKSSDKLFTSHTRK